MTQAYIEMVHLLSRLHRSLIEAIKAELDTRLIRDINAIQALILFNIGDHKLTVGELMSRGCYQGANVTYNLHVLVRNKYVTELRSAYDRRIRHVQLTKKGHEMRHHLASMHKRHVERLPLADISESDLTRTIHTFERLELVWRAIPAPSPVSADPSS